jgi:hypothetical protein
VVVADAGWCRYVGRTVQESSLPVWILAVFPAFFAAMWASVLFLLSVLGGWRALAKRYPAGEGDDGVSFSWRTGRLGWVNYSSCLNLRVGTAGLRIAVSAPFRPAHPPLFVPWQDVATEPVRRLFFPAVKLRFRGVPGSSLELSERLASQLVGASREAFRLPRAGE